MRLVTYREPIEDQMNLLKMYARTGRQSINLFENIQQSGLNLKMGLDDDKLRQALATHNRSGQTQDKKLYLAKKAIKRSILGYRIRTDEGKPGSMTRTKGRDDATMPE